MRILFVHQGKRSFFDRDIEILKSIAEVQVVDNFPPSLQKMILLCRAAWNCDLLYIWFLGRHAYFPLILGKILRKRIILVAGGWDVANCPEIHYGLMRPGTKRELARGLFRLPDIVLSISKSNQMELFENVGISKVKSKLIYLGFEGSVSRTPRDKEPMVLTMGDVNSANLTRKGLEQFVRAAALLPGTPFVLIGRWASDGSIEKLKEMATPNVTFTGYLDQEEVDHYLSRAAVYTQFSYHEAFGCSLAEAMLFECVPVVTDRFALPEVVGDCGYRVPFGNPSKSAEAIRLALNDPTMGKKCEIRISTLFSLQSRRQQLAEVIQAL